MKDNRGFTLVELIVVMAIIGILAGAASYSLSAVSTTRIKSFADKLSACISQCRVNTLSGSPTRTYLEVTKEDDGYYATLYEGKDEHGAPIVKSSEKLGDTNIACVYNETIEVDGTNTIIIEFDRLTGAFTSSVSSVDIATGAGGYRITLVQSTGYHMVEKQGGS